MNRESQGKSDTIESLRAQIRKLEGCQVERDVAPVLFGIDDIDQAMPGGSFPLGAIHDFRSQSRTDALVTAGFIGIVAGLIARQKGAVLWVSKSRRIFPPGMKWLGIDPRPHLFPCPATPAGHALGDGRGPALQGTGCGHRGNPRC